MEIKGFVKAYREAELALRLQEIRLYGHSGKVVKGIKKDAEYKAAAKAYKAASTALKAALEARP